MSSSQLDSQLNDAVQSAQPRDVLSDPADTNISSEAYIDTNDLRNETPLEYQVEDEHSERPNRFKGPRETWRNYTAPDREIAASLEHIKAKDLSIHLYNTHALKVRARGMKIAQTPHEEHFDDEPTEWEPRKEWTAWPLPASEVPRETQDRQDENEGVFRTVGAPYSSRQELDEILASIITQKSRERFKAREWENSEEDSSSPANIKSKKRSRSTSRMSRKSSTASTSSPEASTDRGRSSKSGSPKKRKIREILEDETSSSSDADTATPTNLNPIPIMDDARVTAILQPSTNHIISNLGNLLDSLHLARETYVNQLEDSDSSTDDSAFETSSRSSSRSPLITPRRRQLRDASLTPSIESDDDLDLGTEEGLDDEDISPPETPRGRRFRRNSTGLSSLSPQSRAIELQRLRNRMEPRGWSDILGTAVLSGWNPEVVQRAQARCELLFGEKMNFTEMEAKPDIGEEAMGMEGAEIEESVRWDWYLGRVIPQRGWRGIGRNRSGPKQKGEKTKKKVKRKSKSTKRVLGSDSESVKETEEQTNDETDIREGKEKAKKKSRRHEVASGGDEDEHDAGHITKSKHKGTGKMKSSSLKVVESVESERERERTGG